MSGNECHTSRFYLFSFALVDTVLVPGSVQHVEYLARFLLDSLQGAGQAVRPQMPDLVYCMLESLSSLEDQRLNYAEVLMAYLLLLHITMKRIVACIHKFSQ